MTGISPRILEINYRRLSGLRPFGGNARRHSRKQLAQIAASIQKFGFTNPVLITDDNQILAGHARVDAAKSLGMSEVPTVRLSQMTEADRRAQRRLMGDERAQLMFTDPPYNVPIMGHVCGLGRTQHREFAMAAGEMTSTQFTGFLRSTLGNGAAYCADGSIAFICMDWRHMTELSEAGRTIFNELKNVCVWNKTNGGMGTFYRSKHELVFVFKVGDAPHVNTFGLGDTGRYRTNIWDYPGVNSPHPGRSSELEMHPTVKPVALVKDAILDCSRRGAIVLDMFGGSGTTLIAAERSGRTARLIEFDPLYCDVIVRRYEELTGRSGRLEATGQEFATVADDVVARQRVEEATDV